MNDLQEELARTLEISPDEILTFKPYPNGYSVITTDMKKFTGVQPTPGPVLPDDQANAENSTDNDDDTPYWYNVKLPDELINTYEHPKRAKVANLREVAKALDLPHGNRMTKAKLIKEIEEFKEADVNS